MRQFTPTTEVDFVVIGSGAAGRHHGQAAVGGRLFGRRARAGRLGKVRPRPGIHQGRVAESQPGPGRSADERSGAAAQHVPPERQGKGRRPARTATAAWSAAAPSPTAAAAGATCRRSSTKLTHGRTIPSGTGMADWPITYEELEPYYMQAEWEMGISGLRVEFAVRGADVEGLSGAAGAAEGSGALFNIARRRSWA